MLRIAVCDDNNVSCVSIEKIVKSAFERLMIKVRTVTHLNGITLMKDHCREPFDIIFLDIDMPEMTGFDVAETLRKNFSKCIIIFITSHSELVYESLDFQPFHFIRKSCSIPLSESIPKVIEKLADHMQINERIILEDDISGRCAVHYDEIIFIKGDRHYVEYHIVGKEEPVRMRGTMKECEEKFSRNNFVKIHKSYILNLKYLRTINLSDSDITLKTGGRRLPMGRSFKKSIDEKYTLYLRSMS